MSKNGSSSQQKFVAAAYTLFSERGFYGVSLADVAAELGLTKQAVLYHFATKEALYSEVLRQLAQRFETIVGEVRSQNDTSDARFERFVERLHEHLQDEPRDARLIARELLDNLDRAETSRIWYLKPFLDECVALLSERSEWANRSLGEKTAAIYQMIGAINYFAISGATLKGIWGTKRVSSIAKAFLPTLLENSRHTDRA